MKNNKKKRIVSKLLLLAMLLGIGGQSFISESNISYAKANEFYEEKNDFRLDEIEPSYVLKRKYVEVPAVGIWNDPPYIFYQWNGMKGYLGRTISMGGTAIYAGYIYAGDQYPIPPDLVYSDDDSFSLSSIETKIVRVTRKYKNLQDIVDVWYDDGVYRGWLKHSNAEVYQNSDWSYTVYYVGKVYRIPNYVPAKVESER